MKRTYHTIERNGKANARKLGAWLSGNGQFLLPMVELIEQSRMAVDQVIGWAGRATVQTVLELSAEQVTGGPPKPGQARPGTVVWYGRQPGTVRLRERQLRVSKPRLRRRGGGRGKEVPVPAYQAMQGQDGGGARMLEILLRGVSTRNYEGVLPEMAETVGVSRSSVSREAIEASKAELERLLSRRLDQLGLLIVYLDGMVFGDYTLIAAVGVDRQGRKHVLGVQEGATENAAAVQDLLEDLVARGLDPQQKLLFVIDGSKALRAAINAVFGSDHPVQRCRAHKLRNVLERLPQEQKDQVRAAMRAAWRLDAKTGMAKLRKLSEWLEREWPPAAASLLEGLEECFTLNRLQVSVSLHRCLATTNIIESPQSGVRLRTRRVCRWRNVPMVKRWAAAAFLATEKHFNRIMGYKDLWMLEAILRGSQSVTRREVA